MLLSATKKFCACFASTHNCVSVWPRCLAWWEGTGEDLKRADDAEQRLSKELRRLGQEAMQGSGWADRQVHDTK